MKFIYNVTSLLAIATLPSLTNAGRLRGADKDSYKKKVDGRKLMKSHKGDTTTTTKKLYFAGITPGLDQCMDQFSLCAGFDAVASDIIETQHAAADVVMQDAGDSSNSTHVHEQHKNHGRALAHATAGFLCGVAHDSFAESYSFFEASMLVNVETSTKGVKADEWGDIKSIELLSNFETSSVSFAFSGSLSGTASFSHSSTGVTTQGGHGIVYTNENELCDVVSMNDLQTMEDFGLETMEEVEIAQDLVCSNTSPLPTHGGASSNSASVAVAGSMSSSIATSLSQAHAKSYFKVDGKDIQELNALMIAGVSSFSASDSASFSASVSASWSESMSYIESNETVCVNYVEEYCSSDGFAINGNVDGHPGEAGAGHVSFNDGHDGNGFGAYGHHHAHCEEYTPEEICSAIIAFAGANAGAFSAAFAGAAAHSLAQIELTAGFGVHVSSENNEFFADGGGFVSHPVSFYPTCNNHYHHY